MSSNSPIEPTAVYTDVRIDGEAFNAALAQRFKQFLIITGAMLVVVGALIAIWPSATAKVIMVVLAISVIFSAIANLMIAFTAGLPKGSRILAGLVGVLFAWAGIYALFNLGSTTNTFAFIVGLFIGISWIIDGIVALVTIGDAPSKVWAAFFGLISIAAGIFVLFAPGSGARTIWVILGIILVVMGAAQIVRGLRFGKGSSATV